MAALWAQTRQQVGHDWTKKEQHCPRRNDPKDSLMTDCTLHREYNITVGWGFRWCLDVYNHQHTDEPQIRFPRWQTWKTCSSANWSDLKAVYGTFKSQTFWWLCNPPVYKRMDVLLPRKRRFGGPDQFTMSFASTKVNKNLRKREWKWGLLRSTTEPTNQPTNRPAS